MGWKSECEVGRSLRRSRKASMTEPASFSKHPTDPHFSIIVTSLIAKIIDESGIGKRKKGRPGSVPGPISAHLRESANRLAKHPQKDPTFRKSVNSNPQYIQFLMLLQHRILCCRASRSMTMPSVRYPRQAPHHTSLSNQFTTSRHASPNTSPAHHPTNPPNSWPTSRLPNQT